MRYPIAVTAFVAATVVVAPLGAQGRAMAGGRSGMPGCVAGAPFCQYDTTSVATLRGNVVSVDTLGAGRMGVRLQVRFGRETMPVHLGPAWVLDRDGMTFAPGDRIDLVGSRVHFDGAPAVIAREVTKAGKTLRLRDRVGMPLWAGPRRSRDGV